MGSKRSNMAIRVHFFCILVLFNLLSPCHSATPTNYSTPLNRSSFPASFVFGAATAAYQIEGAAHDGGKGPSIWDTFVKKHPEKISDQSTGDVAIDFYHRYKEDIHLLKGLGMKALRLSISWPRVLPSGKISGGVNPEGVKFYNNVINELTSNGLKPYVTLLHWDVPQALEDEYGGLLHPNIVNDYRDYVDVCFKEFGDRVKNWITMNEPVSVSMNGYAYGTQAPGRCSNYIGNCTSGDSATEPYIAAHHQLLAHAAAVKLYREKYQTSQKGEIGITLASYWIMPKTPTAAGLKASHKALDFTLGWYLHPLTYGDYPRSMRATVGHRLPKFSAEQSKMLNGSMDFVGINYYTSKYASFSAPINTVNLSYTTDSHVDLTTEKNGSNIGQPTALSWLYICPKGIKDLMLYIKEKYNNPAIYITENGMADLNNSTLSVKEAIQDSLRISYIHDHLWHLQTAIKEGANVKGYFAWTLFDDFEWDAGFTMRFGLFYIDYKDGLKRYPKHSAFWDEEENLETKLAMAIQGSLLLGFLVLVNSLAWTELDAATDHVSPLFNRSSFPAGFMFGASSAAYQYEGAYNEGGKGPSIWDNFTHTYPDKILNRSNGDVADDFYHRYKEDVKLMKFIGLDAFRFSISWPRILPRGKLSEGVNKEGVAFYNNLINELLANGIQPLVTIFHWDLPQALEDEYEGFLSTRIVDDFKDFAEVCFKEFGDRVKHWITMNEPYIFITNGYDSGALAPGRCSAWMNNGCPAGNSAIEPYVVAHNMLLCHSATIKLYREKYQASQKGEIGITLVSNWMVPYSNSKPNVKAAQRALDFMYGWFIHPVVYGDYPQSMRAIVGKRLPRFTAEQAKLLKGSFDFIGLNYYTANYAANVPFANSINVSATTDSQANLTSSRNGKPIGDPTGVSIFFVYPQGLRDLLVYTKEKYNNPTIYITENGIGDANNSTVKEGVKDTQRIDFYRRHLLALKQAIKEGVKVKGFFAWTFLDTFEWGSGYTLRFGLNYVDYNDGLKRYPKFSALWFKNFLRKE
ncbi:hypothetical protein F0562_018675 [Nyssa sinensis]|uniref:Beta-glucosidase n=1 Tax=Nyssa sinensis TaxID=561372 RepID=A0A5J4ZD57_9ASTE|nr:hypothetical protein F0562_018675 [Nyssa sinensis]